MTDGNTALPVSPVSKEEAMNLQSMFSKVAQVLVDASTLPDQIKALSAQVDRLTQDLSNKTIHAEELDRTVHELRQQRDEARLTASHLEAEINLSKRDLEQISRANYEQATQIHNLSDALDQAKRERDEYGMQVLALEEQVTAWKDKAEKARVRLNDVMAVFKQDEPEAEAKPDTNPPLPRDLASSGETGHTESGPTGYMGSAPEPAMQPVPEPVQELHPVQATAEPVTPPPAPEVETLDHWEPGAEWDFDRGCYTRAKAPKPNDDKAPF